MILKLTKKEDGSIILLSLLGFVYIEQVLVEVGKGEEDGAMVHTRAGDVQVVETAAQIEELAGEHIIPRRRAPEPEPDTTTKPAEGGGSSETGKLDADGHSDGSRTGSPGDD